MLISSGLQKIIPVMYGTQGKWFQMDDPSYVNPCCIKAESPRFKGLECDVA